MADFLATNVNDPTTRPTVKNDGADAGGRLVRDLFIFTMAAQASGSRLMLGKVPKGARGIRYRTTASATCGAACTLAIGITGNTGKYRTAAVHTAVDTPEIIGKAAILGAAALAADEEHFITLAVAAIAAAGTLVVEREYTLAGK